MHTDELTKLQEEISTALTENPDKNELYAHSEHIAAGSIFDANSPNSWLRAMKNTVMDYQDGEPRNVPIVDGEPYRMGLTVEVDNSFDTSAFDQMVNELYDSVVDEQDGILGAAVNRPLAHFIRPDMTRQYMVSSAEYGGFSAQFVESGDANYIVMGQVNGAADSEATFDEAGNIAQYLDEVTGL